MNEIKLFTNKEFGEIRTMNIDEEPWFVGKDVAEALGYSNASKAVSTHVGEEDRILKVLEADSQNGNVVKTQTALINESGLYALIFGSKLESAKRFKHWVTSEVLPAIRKTGSYQKPMSPVEMMRIQLGMIDDHEGRITDLEQNMTIDYEQQMSLGDIKRKKLEVIDIRRELPVMEEDESDDDLTPFLLGVISVAIPLLMTAVWAICGY